MMRFTASRGSELLPEGQYDAALQRVEQASNANGPYLKWRFGISLHGEDRGITGVTGMNLDAGSKARFWTEALLERPLRDGEEVDLEKLYGRVCRLELTIVEKDGRQFSRITRVTAKPAGVKLVARKAPEPTEDEAFGNNPF